MDTYAKIYDGMLSAKNNIGDNLFFAIFEISLSEVGFEFLKNNDDFFDISELGANALIAFIGFFSRNNEIKEKFSRHVQMFCGDINKIVAVLQPNLEAWIKQNYQKNDINSLALAAVIKYMSVDNSSSAYGEMIMFLKELKRLESIGIASEDCGKILASLAILTEKPLSYFEADA